MATSFENIVITREGGLVELRIHHRGGSAVWDQGLAMKGMAILAAMQAG